MEGLARTVGVSQNAFLKEILQPGESWEAVPHSNEEARQLLSASQRFSASGPEGRVYQTETLAGKVWLISGSHKMLIDAGLKGPTGIALSPDGLWLAVAESKTHWGYSYRVQSNGSVQNKQRFYWFHVPDTADDSGAGPWVMDREGRLYAATRVGVQVFDRNGRVRAILPVPGGQVTGLAFGGANLDMLYVSCGDHKNYRRKLNVAGARPEAVPIKLPVWSAG
jgi:sugar lactone lactonase YvrE